MSLKKMNNLKKNEISNGSKFKSIRIPKKKKVSFSSKLIQNNTSTTSSSTNTNTPLKTPLTEIFNLAKTKYNLYNTFDSSLQIHSDPDVAVLIMFKDMNKKMKITSKIISIKSKSKINNKNDQHENDNAERN